MPTYPNGLVRQH